MIRGLLQKFRKPVRRTPAQRMLTLKTAPVYYLPITKSGSTYLKNLFYYLDHEKEHFSGLDIHSNSDDLQRAKAGEEEVIRQSQYAFTVLRDPVDRFISLYFDKIYRDGPRNFPDVRSYLVSEIGLDLAPNLDVTAHRRNCDALIDWLALNLAHETDQPINHHWRRQSSRLRRVNDLNITHLTLEGLSWQLPLFLDGLIPNLSQAMKAVTSHNHSIKPFKREELLDAALSEKIETVYSQDKNLHHEASEKWQPWRKPGHEITNTDQMRCLSTIDGKLNYVATPKVGCTYVRNLMYLLNHNETFHSPLLIHTVSGEMVRDRSKIELDNSISFFVVRDPVERFFSLYFDKILGTGEQSFPWITRRLTNHRGFVSGENVSIEQHRQNSDALLGYIARTFRTETPQKVNSHWSPQVEVNKRAIRFGLKPLLLEKLEEQLVHIAAGQIEGLESAIASMSHRNRSTKPVSIAEIMTPEIAERISVLYGDDQALYERVKVGWTTTGQPPIL